MTIHLLFGRSTLHRLHARVNRNLLLRRHESTKSQTSPQNASSQQQQQQPPKQRTIPGPSWAWIDPLLTPFRAYSRMQQRSPLTTQLESTLIIYYLGDLLSQTVATDAFTDHPYEPIRGLRAMLIGSLSSIPSYKWFIFLGTHFNYKSWALSIATKIVVNQTFFTPVFNTYFFGMQTLLAGGSWAEAKERVLVTVPVSWRNSWKVWPVVTAFSFTFVPWQYRNVFAGVIAIQWQAYLTWLNRREEAKLALSGGREGMQGSDGSRQGMKAVGGSREGTKGVGDGMESKKRFDAGEEKKRVAKKTKKRNVEKDKEKQKERGKSGG